MSPMSMFAERFKQRMENTTNSWPWKLGGSVKSQFRLSKDDFTRHSEMKKKKRKTEEEVGR